MKKKYYYVLFLAVCIRICCCGNTAYAKDYIVDGFKFKQISATKAAVVECIDKTAISIKVPSSVLTSAGFLSVAEVGEKAFQSCDALYITLPDSIVRIGDQAFSDCDKLATLRLPSGLTTIGEHAFDFTGLTSIFIPKNVREIGDCAFGSCKNLESLIVDPENDYFAFN